jgi:cysteinyl-tRNA synthetase
MTAQLQALRESFVDSMDDDFNTARAIGHLFDAVRLVNTALAEKKPGVSHGVFLEAGKTLLEIGSVLGFFLEDPDSYLRRDREREAAKRDLPVAEIERLIAERRLARAAKAWQRADEIRKELAGLGVILQDGPDATTWTIA